MRFVLVFYFSLVLAGLRDNLPQQYQHLLSPEMKPRNVDKESKTSTSKPTTEQARTGKLVDVSKDTEFDRMFGPLV